MRALKLLHGVRLTLLACLAGIVVEPAFGDEPGPDASPALRRQLLDDLSTDLFEGLENVPPAKTETPASESVGRAGDQGDDEQPPVPPGAEQRDVKPPAAENEARGANGFGLAGEDLGGAANDPVARVGQRMRRAEELILRRDTSLATQRLQGDILADLASLIEQLEKSQCQGGQCAPQSKPRPAASKPKEQAAAPKPAPATNPQGQSPAKESTDRVFESNDVAARGERVQALLKHVWGHLPEKARQEMQAAAAEEFLPKYESLIEEYYRRLVDDAAPRP